MRLEVKNETLLQMSVEQRTRGECFENSNYRESVKPRRNLQILQHIQPTKIRSQRYFKALRGL